MFKRFIQKQSGRIQGGVRAPERDDIPYICFTDVCLCPAISVV